MIADQQSFVLKMEFDRLAVREESPFYIRELVIPSAEHTCAVDLI